MRSVRNSRDGGRRSGAVVTVGTMGDLWNDREWYSRCWRLTPLGCSPYIFHSHRMGNTTTINYKPKMSDGFTSVPPLLASYHLTP